MGRPICPLRRIKYRDREITETVEGRVLSLTEIRKNHLERMNNMGLLRNTATDGLSARECKKILDRLGGELNQKIP